MFSLKITTMCIHQDFSWHAKAMPVCTFLSFQLKYKPLFLIHAQAPLSLTYCFVKRESPWRTCNTVYITQSALCDPCLSHVSVHRPSTDGTSTKHTGTTVFKNVAQKLWNALPNWVKDSRVDQHLPPSPKTHQLFQSTHWTAQYIFFSLVGTRFSSDLPPPLHSPLHS